MVLRRPTLTTIGFFTILLISGLRLEAQRGGMGGMGGGGRGGGGGGRAGGGNGEGRTEPAISAFSEKDVDNLDPPRVILAKAKTVKLNDTQKKALDSLASPFEWNIHIYSRRIDSLQNALREDRISASARRGGFPTDSATSTSAPPQAGDAGATRQLLVSTLQSIRQARDSSEARSLRLLDDTQKSKAVPILGESREKLEAILDKSEFPNGRGAGG